MSGKAVLRSQRGPPQSDERLAYGLHYIAQHNSGALHDQGLGISFNDDEDALEPPFFHEDSFIRPSTSSSYPDPRLLTPPSPGSSVPSNGGLRTRSGRAILKRTDSPLSSIRGTSSRVSKSPRPKRSKAGKVDKDKSSRIAGPLSELTKESEVPVKDMDAWVNRPAAVRMEELEKRKGHIARPMNSFMLYRSAYADRTKAWCKQNNHQVVSSVAGESWPLEPDEVREMYNEYARLERAHHAETFPNYKFSPSKTNARRRKEEDEDDGDDFSFDDPDADYAPSRRRAKPPRSEPQEQAYQVSSPYTQDPYMYATSQQHYQNPYPVHHNPYQMGWQVNSNVARPLPTAVRPVEQYGAQYYQAPVQQRVYGMQIEDMRARAVATPVSAYGAPLPVGLPGSQHHDLYNSRVATPIQYQQQQFQQSVYDHGGVYYTDHGAHPYYVQQAPEESNFDNAFQTFPEAEDLVFGDASWANLDPSLMIPTQENEYEQLVNGEHLGGH